MSSLLNFWYFFLTNQRNRVQAKYAYVVTNIVHVIPGIQLCQLGNSPGKCTIFGFNENNSIYDLCIQTLRL